MQTKLSENKEKERWARSYVHTIEAAGGFKTEPGKVPGHSVRILIFWPGRHKNAMRVGIRATD